MNNAREIIRSYEQKFMKNPSEWTAHALERLAGYDVDFSNRDAGEPPIEVREYLGNCTDEELGRLLATFY